MVTPERATTQGHADGSKNRPTRTASVKVGRLATKKAVSSIPTRPGHGRNSGANETMGLLQTTPTCEGDSQRRVSAGKVTDKLSRTRSDSESGFQKYRQYFNACLQKRSKNGSRACRAYRSHCFAGFGAALRWFGHARSSQLRKTYHNPNWGMSRLFSACLP